MINRQPTLKQYLNQYNSAKYYSQSSKNSKVNKINSQTPQRTIQNKVSYIRSILIQKLQPEVYKLISSYLQQILKISSLNCFESTELSQLVKKNQILILKTSKSKNSELSHQKISKQIHQKRTNLEKQKIQNKENQENFFNKMNALQKKSNQCFSKTFGCQTSQMKSLSSFSQKLSKNIQSQPNLKRHKKTVSFQPPQLQRKFQSDINQFDAQSIRNTQFSCLFKEFP